MTEFDSDLLANTTSMRRLTRLFLLSTLTIVFGVGGWSVAAKVDSAVVTSGTFVVQSSAQAVQHLEGGVIGAILVKEGDLVREGQVLVRLDAAKVTAETRILEQKLVDLAAERARLEAELAEKATVTRPPTPVDTTQARLAMQTALSAQQALLEERRSARSSQLAQLAERQSQVQAQLDGLALQHKALDEQLAQTLADLADQQMLDRKGLIRRPVLRQTERDVARLRGELGDLDARVANARSQFAEAQLKTTEVTRSARSEMLAQLAAVTAKISETEQERLAALDRFDRLEIRAPRTGLVHELAVHTVGGIVAPGQTLMAIIPSTEPLVVTGKIRPDEVDQVHVGQEATVRVSAFRLPVAPELEGRVTGLSPDQVVDERTGQAFFTVKIGVDPGEQGKLQGKELAPGLPAEILIRGEARRVITYLTQPLTDKLGLAFREK